MIDIESWWRAKPSRWAWIQQHRADKVSLKVVNSFCCFADECIFKSSLTCAYCLKRLREYEAKSC